jgi:hypothetical protein
MFGKLSGNIADLEVEPNSDSLLCHEMVDAIRPSGIRIGSN